MLRKDADDKYKWDIEKLYPSMDAWRKDLNKVLEANKEVAKYKGKLSNKADFLKVCDIEDEIEPTSDKVILYTYISHLDNSNVEWQNMDTEMQQVFNQASILTSFLSNEYKELGEKKMLEFIKGTKYESQALGIKRFFKSEKYILEANVEDALTKCSRSMGAIGEMYTKITLSDKEIPTIKIDGKDVKLTMNKYKDIMKDSKPEDRELRRDASKAYSALFVSHKHSLSYIYQSMWDSWYDTKKLRGIDKTFLEHTLYRLNIPKKVYTTLIKVAKDNSKDNIRYFETIRDIIKKKYNLDEVYTSDSGLRLSDVKDKVSVDEARKNILDAMEKYASKEYVAMAKEALKWGRVDYYEDDNKYTGGYMTSRNHTKPHILMNWTDDFDSMSTLAHEVGHSVHSLFSEKQPTALRDYPIYLAEIASVVAEEMLTQHLIDTTKDDKMKLHLLIEKASRIYGLFFRQTQFADFELQVSELAEKQVPLDADKLAKLFKDIDDEYTGSDVFKKWSDKLPYAWTRISHFFQSPFYVYQYSTCAVAALAFFNKLKQGDTKSLDDFLSLGGSKDPDVILKEVGIDLEKEETYQALIKEFKDTVNQIRKMTIDA